MKKYIALILGFYLFWIAGLPLIFSKAVPVICENLSYNTNYVISAKNPRLILTPLPNARISAEEFSLKSKNSDEYTVIKNPKIKVRLLPLLSLHCHVNKISASDLEMKVNIKDAPELDSDFINKILNSKFQCDALKLNKFKIVINRLGVQEPIIYAGKDIYYRKSGRYVKLNIDSNVTTMNKQSEVKAKLYLPQNNDVKKSDVDVKISNVDIAPIGDFLKNYIPSDIADLSGIVDISVDKNHLQGMLKHCAIINKDYAKSMIFPELIELQSDFNLTRQLISISSFSLKAPRITAHLDGTVSNYLDKSLPELNLNVRLDKSKIEDIIAFLPPIETEDIDLYKLKKYKFYGDIIGNLNIKGDNVEPLINGEIFVNNGILTEPIPNTKGATVRLDFNGKYLNYDVFVPASISEKVWVKGGVELYNVKYADMRVWSTKNVDLALAEAKVNPIHEILNFVIGPVPIMDIKGDGNIDITIKGNRKNPHVWGELNLNNVKTHFLDIPNMVMYDADAVLNFDDENIVFNLKRGKIDGQDVSIKGTCNLSGKFDFEVNTQNQNLKYLYNSIKTSKDIIAEIKNTLPQVDVIDGLINLGLKVYGNVKNIEDIKFNENFFVKGKIELLGNTFGMNNIKVHDTKGIASFDGINSDIDVSSFIGANSLTAKAIIKDKIADINLNIPKLNLNDVAGTAGRRDLYNILVQVIAKYKGDLKNIDYGNLDLYAGILGTGADNKLQISNGEITLKKGKLGLKGIKGGFKGTRSTFAIDIGVDNFGVKPVYSGSLKLNEFELPIINVFSKYIILPEEYKKMVESIKFDKGKINLNAVLNNNNVNASTNLGGVEFTYLPLDLSVKIINGSLYTRKNSLNLNKINMIADDMPILIDGSINNIFTKRDFNIYINSKPHQDFIDKYINNNRVYPIKIKGDIVYWVKFKGVANNFLMESSANIAKEASLYYKGATIGDVENAIFLNLATDIVNNNVLRIREFTYDKLIDSLNSKQTRVNMLRASGGVDLVKDDMVFRDLKIKTNNPTDARIFNIIFGKPNIKQGQFTSDLKFNGRMSNPRVIGNFHIFETNIPFLDTTMKNVSFIFKDRTIDVASKGEVLGNTINFKGTLRNKLTAPYYVENAELYTKILDMNYITDKIKMSQVDDSRTLESFEGFDIKNVVVRNMKMNADAIKLRNINAENVEASASLSEKKQLDINNFKFNIAKGTLDGKFGYNLNNSMTDLTMKAQNIDANSLAYALFDLNNQIYGDLTGNVKLSCNGSDFHKCMETLGGTTIFNVYDGRMPKLGSLEYLLKAGNLFKGGITGLSINSVVDLITPLKTGNFSEIYGNIEIKDGVANDIEISTKGKDLSLFITGQYNFGTSIADMEVLGLLSKKISTMFGPLGNVSLNTLFNVIPGVDLSKDSSVLDNINKIPGIELSSKAFRKFIAEIKGNINGDDYVRSFRWIN